MPMPWEGIRGTRVEGGPDPDASQIVQEIGASARATASLKASAGAALGEGIAGGLGAIGTGLRRSRERAEDREFAREQAGTQFQHQLALQRDARENDPYLSYKMDQIARERATNDLLARVEPTTPERYFAQPSEAGGPGTPLPAIEHSARAVWESTQGKKWDTLPPEVRRRVMDHVGLLQTQQIEMLRPGPEVDALMAKADPATALRVKQTAMTPDTILDRLGGQFREAISRDNLIQQALLQQDLEEAPAIHAEQRGAGPLARVLRDTKTNPKLGVVAETLWSAFENGARVPTAGAGTVSLSAQAAATPDLTVEQVERLKGRYTVQVPEFMVGKDGSVVSSVAQMRSWMNTQKDKLPFLQSIANREPYEIARGAFLYDQGRQLVAGLRGGGAWALKMPDKAKASWVGKSVAGLVEKYGEGPIGGLLATKFLGLEATDEQVLGDQAAMAKEIVPAVDAVVSALRADMGATVGGVSVNSDAALAEAVDREWESGLASATIERAGPLRELAEVPTPMFQEAWRRLGLAMQQDPSWKSMEVALSTHQLPEATKRAAMPKLWSAFQGNLGYVQSTFDSIDPKGRRWDQLSNEERTNVQVQLAQKVVQHHLAAIPPGVTPSMKDLLPTSKQPPGRSAAAIEQQLKNIRATTGAPDKGTVEIVDEATGERHVLEDGKYVRTEDVESGQTKQDPAKGPYAGPKAESWVPAQDAFRWKVKQLGLSPEATDLSTSLRGAGVLRGRTVSPLVDDLLAKQVQGQPFSRHLIETLSRGNGSSLATAYDAAIQTMAQVAEEKGLTLGDVFRELDYAASQDPDDPVLTGAAIFLGEALSPNKAGFMDRQLARVIDVPARKHLARAFQGAVAAQAGQFLGPPKKDTVPQDADREETLRREALFSLPWSRNLRTEQRWQSAMNIAGMGIPAMQQVIGDAAMSVAERRPKDFEDARAKWAARAQKAIEQKKPYTVPTTEGDFETIKPSDPEYGFIPRPLQDWRAFAEWKADNAKKEAAAKKKANQKEARRRPAVTTSDESVGALRGSY